MSYFVNDIGELIQDNPYVGRGIILGETKDASCAVAAYFIMGRSENSRNRIFVKNEEGIFTRPFDASKVKDPSLIIYAAVREYENKLIVTNGDQTDTIYEGLSSGKSFSQSLTSRQYEPDAPNYTPRISGMITFGEDDFTYELSILKKVSEEGPECARYTFSYPATPGLGHFIHTYVGDGDPLPSFEGEPERIGIFNCIDCFTDKVWNALNENNKISLYVRFTDKKTGTVTERIVNKNK